MMATDNALFGENPSTLLDASIYTKFKMVVTIYLNIDKIPYFDRETLLNPIHGLLELECLKDYNTKLIGESPSDSLTKYELEIIDPFNNVNISSEYEEQILTKLEDISKYIQNEFKFDSEQLEDLTLAYTKGMDMTVYKYNNELHKFDIGYSQLDFLEQVADEREKIIKNVQQQT